MSVNFIYTSFIFLLTSTIIGCSTEQGPCIVKRERELDLTINKRLDLEKYTILGTWYLYLSSYGQNGEFLFSPEKKETLDLTSVEFSLYDISFLGEDTVVLSFEPSFNETALIPDPKIDMQVVLEGNKVVGLGSGDAFSFFSENPAYCNNIYLNYKSLSLDLSAEHSAVPLSKWLKANALKFDSIRNTSVCL